MRDFAMLRHALLLTVWLQLYAAEATFTNNPFTNPFPTFWGFPAPKTTTKPPAPLPTFPGWGAPIFKTTTTTATVQGPPAANPNPAPVVAPVPNLNPIPAPAAR